MKQTFFDDITFPVVQCYMRAEEKLLRRIIAQCRSAGCFDKDAVQWDMAQLSDMGGLTRDAVKIIAKESKQAQALLEEVLLEVAKKGLNGEEVSEGVQRVVRALSVQAKNSLNVVNTVMVSGVRNRYGEFTAILNTQRNAILNQSAVEVATGMKDYRQAVAGAVRQLARAGIPSHVDSAGRQWETEGYVSMDLRTTSANCFRGAVQEQANENGLHVFQVSSHAGARPKCAPYQGKFYSDNNTYGEIEDAYGHKISYEPLSNTSYGEPDGLFGINCGHDRIYVSEGFYNRREPLDKEQLEKNRQTYLNSQEQRSIERQIRQAKREMTLLEDSKSEEAKGMIIKVRDLEKEYRSFCDETGRTPRWDRTVIY